ncbi:MAG: hypothetical protein HS116_13990 [Planctomycetes bacterium]|nr:hypothetical protein [Planctomycetota bacterium]
MYLLVAQLALSGAWIFYLYRHSENERNLVRLSMAWLALSWTWWVSVRWLSRAAVTGTGQRMAVLGVAAPVGFGVAFWIMWLTGNGVELYSRIMSRLPKAEAQVWMEAALPVLLIGLALAIASTWSFCSGIAEWAVRPWTGAPEENSKPLRAPMAGKSKSAWALFACSTAILAAGLSFLYVNGRQPEGLQTATLYARIKYGDYEKATISFEHGVRDDYFGIAKNDWDLEYGNGQNDELNVCTVTDDRSVLVDLGPREWSDVGPLPMLPPGPVTTTVGPNMAAQLGHLYLVHTIDSNTNLYVLFRVDELIPNDQIVISWRLVRSIELENVAVEESNK